VRTKLLLILLIPVLALARGTNRFRDRPLATRILVDGQTLPTTASGTGGTFTADTYAPFSGTQSVRLTAGSASLVRWAFTFQATNICNDSFIEVTFRSPNPANVLNLNTLEMWLGDFTNNLKYEFGSFDIKDTGLTYAGEWARVRFPIRRFALTGTYDCSAATRIMLGLKAQTATPESISIARIASYPKRDETGILLIHEDDQWKGWYDYATPTLIALGLKSDMSVNGGRVGQVNFMTRANVQTLCDSKYFRLMNHGWMHDSITDLSLPDARYWVSRNSEYIRSFGPSCDESRILILPFGKHNRPVDSAVRTWKGAPYMPDYMRLQKGMGVGEAQNFNGPYAMRVGTTLGWTVDTTTAKAVIDSAVAQRTVVILLFHQICNGCTPSDDNTWRQDWFISVMNYAKLKINAGVLRNMFTGEFLEQYGAGGFGPARRAGVGR
jgi:hypothetical protein